MGTACGGLPSGASDWIASFLQLDSKRGICSASEAPHIFDVSTLSVATYITNA
jgi:hypothetical protein